MLYKVFMVQWHYPCKGDWTLQIQQDLIDFDMPTDLEILKNTSKTGFKNKVKKKAQEYKVHIVNLKI